MHCSSPLTWLSSVPSPLLLLPLAASATSTSLSSAVKPASLANEARLFNAVHSAMRQWGSSLNHNGMSFMPVTVPAGEMFYHGSHADLGRPLEGMEWLAFEPEHAQYFAVSLEPGMVGNQARDSGIALNGQPPHSFHGQVSSLSHLIRSKDRVHSDPTNQQHPLVGVANPQDIGDRPIGFPLEPFRGYTLTYRAVRDLNLVYIDGMAASKSQHGTLDSTDHVLLGRSHQELPSDPIRDQFDDLRRAKHLCALGKEWDVDGWIRMEAGFEIIYCDFSKRGGLELVSTHNSPFPNETSQADSNVVGGEYAPMGGFEWIRAAAARYGGLPPGRADVDFSGLVSLFSYPLNLSNPDSSRPDLPRARDISISEAQVVRERLAEVMAQRKGRAWSSVRWQRIVDSIVGRYAGAIRMLADGGLSARKMRSLLASLLNSFKDYPADSNRRVTQLGRAIQECRDHFLYPALARKTSWTPEDKAIFASVQGVSEGLCSALFTMRDTLEFSDPAEPDRSVAEVRDAAAGLMKTLGWTTWKECGHCARPEEICFVAMFPVGSKEDHRSPSCVADPDRRRGYWFDD